MHNVKTVKTSETVTRNTLFHVTFRHEDCFGSALRCIILLALFVAFEYTRGHIITSIADEYTQRYDFDPEHASKFPPLLTHRVCPCDNVTHCQLTVSAPSERESLSLSLSLSLSHSHWSSDSSNAIETADAFST